MAQEREKWRVPVKTVMNIRVPRSAGISLLAEKLLHSHERSLVYLANYESHYSASITRLLVVGNMRFKHVHVKNCAFAPVHALR